MEETNMTPRENLLHLLRKEGYEEVPVDFSLCPSQEESYRKNEHSSSDYRDYFQMPWKRLPVLQPDFYTFIPSNICFSHLNPRKINASGGF